MLTQNWWVLAWFGALIWFSITGIRNIIQAVIAGGGFQKGARIDWKSLINWSRVSDSLMYTGMSVVLLEGLLVMSFWGIFSGSQWIRRLYWCSRSLLWQMVFTSLLITSSVDFRRPLLSETYFEAFWQFR